MSLGFPLLDSVRFSNFLLLFSKGARGGGSVGGLTHFPGKGISNYDAYGSTRFDGLSEFLRYTRCGGIRSYFLGAGAF